MAINKSISTHDWLQLSPEIRAKLVQTFNIPRSGVGHVNYTASGPVQTSDGYTYDDLKIISIEALQEKLKINSQDFTHLFSLLVSKLETPEEDVKNPSAQQTQEKLIESWVSKLKEIRLTAEEKGLIKEFIMTLKNELKVKK